MRASSLCAALRACVLALCLCLLTLAAIPALAQNNNANGGAATQQSSGQTTTTTTTQQTQAAQPAQTTRVVERETGTSPTLYWVIGLAVLALVVIVAIVALGKRSNREV
jgi:beta-lactamase regulating signal transducer with metallopeptidase domain